MSERVRKPDYFRDARRTIGLVVIVLDFLFFVPLLFGLVQMITGGSGDAGLERNPLPWALYAGTYVFITASVVPAVRIFRTEDRRRSWQLTGWMAVFFMLGIALAIVFAFYVDHRNGLTG